MIKICRAEPQQIDEIMRIYAYARDFMKNNGNPNQWAAGYPSEEIILRDISEGNFYVGTDEAERICFAFAFIVGIEPTYNAIEQGDWLNDKAYGTIHRIAGGGTVNGVFEACLKFCLKIIPNIRIDTHKDNKIMQHLVEKHGFQRCGIIHLQNGSERIAYQLMG